MHLRLDAIPRVENILRNDFQYLYLQPNRPVIITGLASSWPALRKWAPDFFREKYGHKKVRAYNASFATPGKDYMSNVKEISLADYVHQVLTSSMDLRMFLYNIMREIPQLRDDIIIPSIATGFSKRFMFLFFGCKGSVTPMHYDIDMSHVFHTPIYGKKRVTLFPYEEWKNLYKHPFTTRSYVDVDNPDFEKFPRVKNAHGSQAVLEPGETLFIPSGYWHHIVYEEGGYAVSLRCRHQSLVKMFEGFANLLVLSSIDRIMNKVLSAKWFRWKEKKAHEAA